jgi:uncharacterized iron-regulated membrane protein
VSSVCLDGIHTHELDYSAIRGSLGAMVSSIHFGHTFGWLGTPVIVMTGLMICVGSVVGFLVWWMWIFGRKPTNKPGTQATEELIGSG